MISLWHLYVCVHVYMYVCVCVCVCVCGHVHVGVSVSCDILYFSTPVQRGQPWPLNHSPFTAHFEIPTSYLSQLRVNGGFSSEVSLGVQPDLLGEGSCQRRRFWSQMTDQRTFVAECLLFCWCVFVCMFGVCVFKCGPIIVRVKCWFVCSYMIMYTYTHVRMCICM